MTLARLDEVVAFDEEGGIVGLQFDGRARRIQEAQERKEAQEFAELVARLERRNWAKRSRATPEGYERQRAAMIRYREANRARMRQLERDRRRRKYEENPVVNKCQECGREWPAPYEKCNKRSRFCSRSCRNRNHGRTRVRPTLGIRQMDVREAIFAALRPDVGATAKAIAKAVGGKEPSVKTLLSRMARAGEIASDRRRPALYSLKPPSSP